MRTRNTDDDFPWAAVIGISLTLLFGGLVLYMFCHSGGC